HYPFPLYRLFFCPANRVWEQHDFFDEIDDLMGYEGASEVIFVPEEYGLDKEATIQEIVDYILENQNIG
ncbi:hypothetical protein, partial [Faecalibacterium sp.]